MQQHYKSQFKKMSEREIKKDLRNIYESDDGEVIDISRLEPRRKRGFLRFLTLLGLVLLVLASVAWAGFWVFNKYAPDKIKQAVTDSGEIELAVTGPEKADSGNEVQYVIKYSNKKKVALNNVSLNVRYPVGLMISSLKPDSRSQASPNKNNPLAVKEDNWDLGALAKGASGEVKISGRLIAESGTSQNLFVVLYYEPANFSSIFQKEVSYATIIASAPVEIKISGTDEIVASDEVDLTLAYANTVDHDLADILIEVKYPDGFSSVKTDPAPVSGSNHQWQFPVLEKGAKGKIKIKGKFAANIIGSQEFIGQSSMKGQNEEYLVLAKNIYAVEVISGALLVELKINSSDQAAAANFGDVLNYSLTYENNSQDILKNLTASVFFVSSSDFIQWNTLNDRYDGALAEFEAGKMLSWTEKEVPNLAELKPGEKGVIDFSLRLSSSAGEMSGDLSLQSVASVKIGMINKKEVSIESKSNSLATKLNSNLNLSASGRYFNDNGVSIGSGPIPPRAGQATNYVIIWQLSNSVHEIRDLTVSAVLPNVVTWIDEKDITAGDIEYQPDSRKVVWTINRMPTTIDLNYQASFEISITPGTTDVGKILALTGDNNLAGTDQVTSAKISQTAGAITTDLVNDPVAKGKGLVEK